MPASPARSAPLPPGRAAWLAANVLPHEPALRGWLSRRGVRGGDVDDLVQEGYAALAAMTDVAHIDSPKAYMFRTVWSLMLREVRRAQVVSIEAVADLASLDIEADAPDPERQLGARQELRRLAAAIDNLPPGCRDVFRLRKVEGLSQREVAARTGLSESTVEKHIGRAVRLLGHWLASDEATASERMRLAFPMTSEANDRA